MALERGAQTGGLRWKNGIVLSNPPVQAAGRKALSLSAALLLFCSGNSFVHAQEAAAIEESFTELLRVVEDKDGVANVRAGASLEAKVTGKVAA